jgi:hypothetical protein
MPWIKVKTTLDEAGAMVTDASLRVEASKNVGMENATWIHFDELTGLEIIGTDVLLDELSNRLNKAGLLP